MSSCSRMLGLHMRLLAALLAFNAMDRTWKSTSSPLALIHGTSCAGFHTFDYARHFMSCCSRMLGLEHVANRGSISIEYYGRDVGIKIMPTGVKPERFLNGFGWQDTIWRRGELMSQVIPPVFRSTPILHQECTAVPVSICCEHFQATHSDPSGTVPAPSYAICTANAMAAFLPLVVMEWLREINNVI